MEIELSIIIVNYKTPSLVINCLNSIYENSKCLNIEIIIVDNYSNDNSKELITNLYPEVIWLQNNKNEGFGLANNNGIKIAKSSNVLLLNSDTIIIDNAIVKIFNRFISDIDKVGVATCQLLNADFTKQKSVFYYNSSYLELMFYNVIFEKFLSVIKFKKSNKIKSIHGACMIFNKNKLHSIGYFDSNFFMYSEEFEWCYRIMKNGFDIKCYNEISIIHLDGGSKKSSEWSTKQRMVSNALLFRKNRGFLGYILYLAILIFNLLTNYLILWRMDKNYRSDYFKQLRNYYSIIKYYFQIAFFKNKTPLSIID